MRTQFSKFALEATLGLALAFTFSCSSGGDDETPEISCSVVQSEAPSLGGIFEEGGNTPDWFGEAAIEYARNNLFQPGNVAEFLPVPKHIYDLKSIMAYYPRSVGTLFDIADAFRNEVAKLRNAPDDGTPHYYVPKDGNMNNGDPGNMEPLNDYNVANFVTLNASVHYGNTAYRDSIVVNCTDPIFRYGNYGNCYTNEYNYYLAWDLKDNCGKFVKAGTYKATTKFSSQVKYFEKNANGSFAKKEKSIFHYEFTKKFEVKY